METFFTMLAIVAGGTAIILSVFALFYSFEFVYQKIRRRIVKRKKTSVLFDFNKYTTDSRVNHTTCCGLCELCWLEDGPEAALAVLAAWQQGIRGFEGDGSNRTGNYKPLVVFTDAVAFKNGVKLAKFIEANKLGTIVTLPSSRNPNSGNMVQAWLWRIDRPVWDAWVEKSIVFEGD